MTALNGKVFALTGAASGIGLATAKLLAQRGASLSLADVDANRLAAAAEQVQKARSASDSISNANTSKLELAIQPILSTVLDVRSSSACREWISATFAHFEQPLSGAANLAGVVGRHIAQASGTVRNLDDENEWDFVMDVNFRGTVNCIRAELAYMREGGDGRGGGSIVNAASIAALVGVECNGPYVASKHAVAGITKTVAKEEGDKAIRCNAIAPGIIATPMITQIEEYKGSKELFGAGDPGALRRKGDAEEVAELIVFLLSDQSSFINGTIVPVEGGWIC
ncbi:putative short chain dehydrogenase/ reductase [Polyplosphaeria fusca]|uniref:Short chain dehydrogenase/ reductase n=1 Tax=Polyplosphaeria fusca TaxID=682080 RepID=A0A9P4UVZ1_9PLEO|nr:putative short chain dehydrogenase/ reductase [Polyplosphaeria fusca]